MRYWSAGRGMRRSRSLSRCWPAQERVSGGEHPETLRTRNNLATGTGRRARWVRRSRSMSRCWPVHERMLGGEHPDTLSTRNNLALAHRSRGVLGEAIAIFEPLLLAQERASGGSIPTRCARATTSRSYTGPPGVSSMRPGSTRLGERQATTSRRPTLRRAFQPRRDRPGAALRPIDPFADRGAASCRRPATRRERVTRSSRR